MTPHAEAPTLLDRVSEKLQCVFDPCSVAAGRPVSIVDLGLLVSAQQDDSGTLHLVLRTTFPGCLMSPHFSAAAEEQLATLPDVHSVEVTIDSAFTWTPDQATLLPLADRPDADPSRGGRPVPWAHLQPSHHSRTKKGTQPC